MENKKENYVEIKLRVDEENPELCEAETHVHGDIFTVTKAIFALDIVKEDLFKQCPSALILYKDCYIDKEKLED